MSVTPHHLAIIMDGNRRWARGRGLDILRGHSNGAERLSDVCKSVFDSGVSWLTVFAFSTENWSRPTAEVKGLMGLLRRFLMSDVDRLSAENVKFRVIGERGKIDKDLVALIEAAEKRTGSNTGLNLTVALDYGGRLEFVRAAQHLAKEAALGLLDPEKITEDMVKSRMFSAALPQIDLLIRTGGDSRISNFMLWDISYAELYFTPVYWPDFSTKHLKDALDAFANRERRFGGDNNAQNDLVKPVPSGSR